LRNNNEEEEEEEERIDKVRCVGAIEIIKVIKYR